MVGSMLYLRMLRISFQVGRGKALSEVQASYHFPVIATVDKISLFSTMSAYQLRQLRSVLT